MQFILDATHVVGSSFERRSAGAYPRGLPRASLQHFYVAHALYRGCFTTRRTFHMPVTVHATSRHSMPTDYLSTVTCSISQDTHICGQRTGEQRGAPSSESRCDYNACHSSSMTLRVS